MYRSSRHPARRSPTTCTCTCAQPKVSSCRLLTEQGATPHPCSCRADRSTRPIWPRSPSGSAAAEAPAQVSRGVCGQPQAQAGLAQAPPWAWTRRRVETCGHFAFGPCRLQKKRRRGRGLEGPARGWACVTFFLSPVFRPGAACRSARRCHRSGVGGDPPAAKQSGSESHAARGEEGEALRLRHGREPEAVFVIGRRG